MSEKKSIEKLFSDALGKADARPPKGTKEDIRKKLIESGFLKDDNSSKRILFWIMGITGLALLSVTVVYYMNDRNKNHIQTITQINENNDAVAIDKKQGNKESAQHDSSTPGSSGSQTGVNEKRTESDSINKSNPGSRNDFNGDVNNGSEIFSKPDKSEKEETSLNEKGKNSIAHGEKTKSIRHDKGKDNSLTVNSFNSKSGENVNSATQSNENEKQDFKSQKNQGVEKMRDPESKLASEPGDSSSLSPDTSAGNENQSKQNEQAGNITTQNTDSAKADEKKHDLLPDLLSKEKNKKRFSIDVFAGPQLSNFKVNGDTSYKALTEIFEISETEKISFSAGIGLNIPMKNFFIEPGINYSLLKSDFSYSKLQTNIDTSRSHFNYIDTTIIVVDTITGGDTITYHIDSLWITISDTSHLKIPVKTSNKISILEIPIWAGYKFSTGKFDIEMKAGASISFITSINTTMLPANSEEVVLYTDRKNSPYRKNYYSILAAANVVYNINDRFSIFLQPAFKYGLGSIFKNDYPISKKIQNYSLGAGLRINF